MIIVHRFTFTHPIQIPGRPPVKEFEPAAPGNVGYTVTLVGGGWLFQAPPGTSGISAGGRDELALCGERDRPIRLAVWVPVDQVVVHYATDGHYAADDDVLHLATDALPTQAPSDALIARRAAPPPVVERAPDPAVESQPVPAAAPPPTAARRRAPPGAAAAAPPPPSQGWVEE